MSQPSAPRAPPAGRREPRTGSQPSNAISGGRSFRAREAPSPRASPATKRICSVQCHRNPACGPSAGYDCNGNVLTDRAGSRRFVYDGENRLISITAPGLTDTLAYDPTGRLNQITTNGAVTNFIWDGDDLAVEYDGSGNVLRRYINGTGANNPLLWFEGPYMDQNHQKDLITDHQGSVIGYTDQTGSIAGGATYTYDAYGSPATGGWGGPRFRYTGQIALPEAQLYYYHARFYDPVAERFLQTDPVGYDSDMNLYAYVRGDPVDRTDPTGMIVPGNIGSNPNAGAEAVADILEGIGNVAEVIGYGLPEGPGAAGLADRSAGILNEGAKSLRAGSELGAAKGEIEAERTYQTYTKTHPETGEVYSGRTSGKGTPAQNLARRDSGHHMNKKGFGPATLDKSPKSKGAIRGREQQLIDKHGGAKSKGGTSGNAINAIAPSNPRASSDFQAAQAAFGQHF